jgi:hypothetical protein
MDSREASAPHRQAGEARNEWQGFKEWLPARSCWKNGARARENERGVFCGLGVGCGQTHEGAQV